MRKNEMSDEARTAYRKYMREWRKQNREKVRLYVKNYWERKAARENATKTEV